MNGLRNYKENSIFQVLFFYFVLDIAIAQTSYYKEKYQEFKKDTDTKKGWKIVKKKCEESDKSKKILELVENILENEPKNKKP